MKSMYIDRETRAIIDIDLPGDDGLRWISRVNVPTASRGQGVARRLMEKVLIDADADGITLALWVIPTGRTGVDPGVGGLVAWYERLGFERGSDSLRMERQPRCRHTESSCGGNHTTASSDYFCNHLDHCDLEHVL